MPPLGDDGEQAKPDATYAASNARAQAAVAAALRLHGLVVDDKATTRIEVSFAVRPAATGVRLGGGGELSPGTHRWALQSCRHTQYRLAVAYVESGPELTAGHGFAEESRCHSDTASLLPRLADKAVAALVGGGH